MGLEKINLKHWDNWCSVHQCSAVMALNQEKKRLLHVLCGNRFNNLEQIKLKIAIMWAQLGKNRGKQV